MTNFDIIGVLRTYAASKDWVFLSGPDWSKNWELTQATLTSGKYILGVDFDATPTIRNKLVGQIKYNGTILLGEKFESTTESSLDELFIQKYDRRLLTLTGALAAMVGDVACSNELDVDSINIKLALNKFDENIDYAIAEVTLTQG